MRNALRTGARFGLDHCVQWHHHAGIALQVDHVQPVGVLLEFGEHFEQDAVLIVGRVDRGSELRTEGVVKRARNGLPVEV